MPDNARVTASPDSGSDGDDGAIDGLSFEEALRRLEAIVHQLEAGDVPLERSISLYEEGERLRARCEDRLRSAQARIERIQLGPDGAPAGLRPLDDD